MAGKRRPLNHSPSLFTPPLSRSSHSAPNPPPFTSHKPPLFTSSSESRFSASQSGSRRTSHFEKSPSRTPLSQRSFSVSAHESQNNISKKYSVTDISNQISSFMSCSSQMGLQVAQTVVSDLLTSPMAHSNSLDPNNILDCLIEQIKENLKQRYVS